MTVYFKGSELVEVAIQIEKNGEFYYRKAAKKTGNEKLKELFLYLADEEVKHKKIYLGLLKSIENFKPAEMFPEEYFQYLRAYANEHIFTKEDELEQKANNVKSDIEAIDLALGFEKDSILYYLELRDLVPGHDKNIIDKIIQEERKHYSKLSEVKAVFAK